jgi:hypothetical protein
MLNDRIEKKNKKEISKCNLKTHDLDNKTEITLWKINTKKLRSKVPILPKLKKK